MVICLFKCPIAWDDRTEQRIQNKIQRKFLTMEYIPYEEIEWGNKDKYATKCTSTFNSPFIPALN